MRLRALLDAGYEVDQNQRGLVNYYQGQYPIAIEAFQTAWAAIKPSEYTPESYFYMARSYRAVGNPSAALTQLQVMLGQFAPDETGLWGDAWLEEADIYAQLGETAKAYETYDQLVSEHPTLSQAPEALYQAGKLAEAVGGTQKAATYYQRLATEYPADTRASEGLFDLALKAYQAKDFSTAETLFGNAAQITSNERPAASSFGWAKRSLLPAALRRLQAHSTRLLPPRKVVTMVSGQPSCWPAGSPLHRRPISPCPAIRTKAALRPSSGLSLASA